LKDPYVHFIRSNPAADSVLEKAGINRAAVTIIPIDWRIESDTLKNSVNTLIMLAVEGSNPETYSCVEIMKSSSRKHLRRTAANEVVCVGDLSVRLLTEAALNPGFSFFVESLLTTTAAQRSRLHKEVLPPVFAGMTFRGLFALLNTRIEEILLAVERPCNAKHPEIYANPRGRFKLQTGDMLFLLGEGGACDLNKVAGSYDGVG